MSGAARGSFFHSSRLWSVGNAGRPAVVLHDIANTQLPPTPGLRLAVHEDLAFGE
jgi:hypothetical protein